MTAAGPVGVVPAGPACDDRGGITGGSTVASVYRKARDKKRTGASWYVAYVDEHGKRRNLKGCPDKQATEAMARKLESEAELRRRGVIDPRADVQARHEARPLAGHLADWHAFMIGKGSTAKHADLSKNRATRVAELAKAGRLSDLTPSRVQAALKAVRDDGGSLRSVHHYTRVIKGFSRWAWRDGRIREDLLAHLTSPNPDQDRRHERRALSADEQARLVRAAEAGRVVMRLAGPDRAMLYRIALGTGFRAAEIRSLVGRSFDLDGSPPTITVAAAYSKHRRDDVQPIRVDLAEVLRPWLAARPAEGPVFGAMSLHTNLMIQADLEVAGIAYRDADGRVVDFHALRHSFVTALARSNAPVKVVQTLARHSTPALTLGVYSHVGIHDQSAALAALPDQPGADGPAREAARLAATGTGPGPIREALGKRAPGGEGQELADVVAMIRQGPGPSLVEEPGHNLGVTTDLSGPVGPSRALSERRGRDSNPRDPCGPCGFQDRRLNRVKLLQEVNCGIAILDLLHLCSTRPPTSPPTWPR